MNITELGPEIEEQRPPSRELKEQLYEQGEQLMQNEEV